MGRRLLVSIEGYKQRCVSTSVSVCKAEVRRDSFRYRFAVNGKQCTVSSLSDAAGFR